MFNQIYYLLKCFRPKQWIKNFVIFFPLIFSGTFLNLDLLIKSFYIFIFFSIFVGATYTINDYLDIEKDKIHPKKSKRPLASGKLNKIFALIISILIIILIPIYIYYNYTFLLSIFFTIYLINTIIYSFIIKHIVILDIFSISFGFIIRGLIGIFVINTEISYWFIIILFFGSLFLGFLKRYQEVMLGLESRKNINNYNSDFLKQIIGIQTSIIIISYTLYTFQSVQSKFMIITLPIVVFIIIRYYYNIFFKNKYKEGIEDIIVEDNQIIGGIILYFILTLIIIIFSKTNF